jgi:hypothetical protein
MNDLETIFFGRAQFRHTLESASDVLTKSTSKQKFHTKEYYYSSTSVQKSTNNMPTFNINDTTVAFVYRNQQEERYWSSHRRRLTRERSQEGLRYGS